MSDRYDRVATKTLAILKRLNRYARRFIDRALPGTIIFLTTALGWYETVFLAAGRADMAKPWAREDNADQQYLKCLRRHGLPVTPHFRFNHV